MPGRQSTAPISLLSKAPKTKNLKRKRQRSLNALAIAEKSNPESTKFRRHRFGESEPDGNVKRRRDVARNDHLDEHDREDDQDRHGIPRRRKTKTTVDHGEEVDFGSDSEGNEWILGGVGDEDDESLDSDEAMGVSDEEKFEDFVFRGSSSAVGKPRNRRAGGDEETSGKIDLSEGDGDGEVNDDFGDEGVDMAAVLDAGSDIEDEEDSGGEFDSLGSHKDAASQTSEDGESENLASDDENDVQSSKKLAELQSLITAMNEQDGSQAAKSKISDANESYAPSEYGISSKQKLTVADLLPSVTDPQLKKSLRVLTENDTSKRNGVAKKLDVPLPKRQQDRLDRKVAYEKSKETLDRWIDTVKHNRRVEHLSFPLQDPDTVNVLGTNKMDRYTKPLTELEVTIQNILQESGLAPTDGKTEEDRIQDVENLETNRMPLAEVQKRRAELRRSRELLFREEIKAKRINKIKSKSYRRVHRKERERLMQKDKDALATAGIEDSGSEKEKNDRRRAEERMGAKHRESRWAKGVKESGRMAWDEDARGGVEEMARREENLRRRILGKAVDDRVDRDSSEDGDDEEDEDGIDKGAESLKERLRGLDKNREVLRAGVRSSTSALSSMKFMQNAEAARKASNDEAIRQMQRELAGEETSSEEEPEENAGRRLYGPNRTMPQPTRLEVREQRSEFEENIDSNDEAADFERPDDEELQIIVDETSSKKPAAKKVSLPTTKQPSALTQPSEAIEDNPWLSGGKLKRNRKAQDSSAAAIISNELPSTSLSGAGKTQVKPVQKAAKVARKVLSEPKQNLSTSISDEDDEDEEEEEAGERNRRPFVLRNQELVRKAFAGDDVVANFEKEKEEAMQSEDEKVIDKTLAGWGHWTGAGIGKKAQGRNKKRVLSKQEGIPKAQRKDAKLDKVIINEKRVKKNTKYLASQLPHPFETRQQYERSLRLPVGPEWTTKETFQAATKPRVLMKQGLALPARYANEITFTTGPFNQPSSTQYPPETTINQAPPATSGTVDSAFSYSFGPSSVSANGSQSQGVWTHPYSLTWSKGTQNARSWGMAISHIDENQRVFGPRNNDIPGSPVRYYINPVGIQSVIISAAELGSSTVLTTDSLQAFSANANLLPQAGSSSKITFPLVQGMGFVTGIYTNLQPVIQTSVFFRSVTIGARSWAGTFKYQITLEDNKSWLLYATPRNGQDPQLSLVSNTELRGVPNWSGFIQVAKNPVGPSGEFIYDNVAGVYATAMDLTASTFSQTGTYEFRWKKAGLAGANGLKLLMFALPHHVESFAGPTPFARTPLRLQTTTKGIATAVIADYWTLVEANLPVDLGFAPWNGSLPQGSRSTTTLSPTAIDVINKVAESEIKQDMGNQADLDSMYFSGKALSKFAALIYAVHELCEEPDFAKFNFEEVKLILVGTPARLGLSQLKVAFAKFSTNQQNFPLVYDTAWKGLVSSGSYITGNAGQDFGNTYYNDHHFHYAYFIHAASIIAYLDPQWLQLNKEWVNLLVRDAANPSTSDPYFPFSRAFDWYHGHSWAKGLFESADAKDEESSSEDAFFAYAIKMWGKVTGDRSMEARGNLMLSVLARTLRNYFLMQEGNMNHPAEFVGNMVSGV
ncbi:MAG: hypothetical protein Q9213_003402, partial [Squamulea squamosa]